jgi:hypothetical protein
MVRIYARSTTVQTLERDEANSFVRSHHSQGAALRAVKLVSLGLFSNSNELLGVAQLCNPGTSRMKREYSTELLRLAFKSNVRVIGGASKLISHYQAKYHPADIFTYQDTTGETTDVYKHCGFKLVRQARSKQYLVAPNKTLSTASKKEFFSLSQVVNNGPDRLLNTHLGEVFYEDGKRMTNPQLFVKKLGWHLEETSGDHIWEWFNPEITFYTYQITASDSNKYYIGVSHVKKANATLEDCLIDGYYGSGGGKNSHNKFSCWKSKHLELLSKEILNLYSKKSDAYASENKLIGKQYVTDPLCLNSTSGGKRGGINTALSVYSYRPKLCQQHGITPHRGITCAKCQQQKNQSIRLCALHGETIHFGTTCCRCSTQKSIHQDSCPIHGRTVFMGGACKKCSASKAFSLQTCSVHGKTQFRGDQCAACLNNKAVTVKLCHAHGETKFIGNKCYRCISESAKSVEYCSIHGETAFVGKSCLKCSMSGRDQLLVCSTHGETLHRGNNCLRCLSSQSVSLMNCPVHGMVKHKGDKCITCISDKMSSVQDCPQHGSQKFRGGKCCKCAAIGATTLKECPVHGMAKHRGDRCYKCSMGGAQQVGNCLLHGFTKFQGESCRKCSAQKTAHTRYHTNPKEGCQYCLEALTRA